MDVNMKTENEGTSVTSGAATQAPGVACQAGSSGDGVKAPDDGEEAGRSGGGGSGQIDGGEAGMSCDADAGPSGSGVPSQYARGERKTKHACRDSRRKRKNNSGAGGNTAKKTKKSGDDDSPMAELLQGMSVRGPDDGISVAPARRSNFNHQRVVMWTTSNWHGVRSFLSEQNQEGNVGMAGTRGRRISQNRGISAEGTTHNSVPEALISEPAVFDREDAQNAAAARARLLRRVRQRRMAVSDSDIDVEHDQADLAQFLSFRADGNSEISSDMSDRSNSSLSSLSDSSGVSTDNSE